MKKAITLFLVLFAAVNFQAQVETPQPSPHAKIWQKVGLTDVTVEYSRPSMRGRTIFGNLVPFGENWRTGANENTSITFSDDVKIDGKTLSKGTYAIYSVPNKKSWEVIFYKKSDNWGLPQKWDANEVALSAKVDAYKMPLTMETFTIVIDELTNDSAILNLIWENTVASLKFEVPTEAKAMKSIENVLNGPSARDYYSAADYYYTSEKDLDQALVWINKSFEGMENPPYYMLRKKSLIEAKLGKKKEAIKTAKASLKAAKAAGNKDYVKMNEDSLKEWGAM
ncbi:DUF2911 domain-containing protein [Mesonia aestuariivivens]|uniref:DUF2911 domain-containing protein n=1 Tax=Mesonia aestuariivivens TaxID=2796128 RepID=A0ABS6W0G7_9FLAO|nr:DUF2911 domain-containing protein [Mesonia aestuariivivens]MBW2960643.1 DUF2911 domain-containing protein [Mesonia aestuariivivens]